MVTFSDPKSLYKNSGVDVAKGDELVGWLGKGLASEKEGSGSLNDFSASYEPDFSHYKRPLLISSTDGVGTKLLLALEQNKLENLGYDLVGMCVNDLYTSGAKALFFLDYYATSKLDSDQFKLVLGSIRRALAEAECKLLGGETAELPGLYHKNHFDLAGFVVGVVDKERRMSPQKTKASDLLYALPSNGFHSNGYSLLRRFLKDKPELQTESLLDHLLAGTKIYSKVPKLFNLLGPEVCHSASHITGGGVSGNLKRMIPDNLTAQISFEALKTPLWMKDFLGNFSSEIQSFESVFNMGCGMIISISPDSKNIFEEKSKELNMEAFLIGEVAQRKASSDLPVVYI